MMSFSPTAIYLSQFSYEIDYKNLPLIHYLMIAIVYPFSKF